MNLVEVKERLYDVTAMFFTAPGVSIIWTEQKNTRPQIPYVTLKTGAIRRPSYPVEDEDGNRIYHCSTVAEVNLYTQGKPLGDPDGKETINYNNTATSDLMDFANFLESEEITNILAGYGIDITLVPPVKDLSELSNNSSYRYRAMAEFTVSFPELANGKYGIGGNGDMPNASGGGTVEMAEAQTEPIETVEITEIS